MCKQVYQQQRRVEITGHAMNRLRERVGSFGDYRGWQQYVRAARYKGRTECMLSYDERKWFDQNIHNLTHSSQVRFFNGFAFIFKGCNGKARTLITVIPVCNEKEDYDYAWSF